jgi:hypothetical protein
MNGLTSMSGLVMNVRYACKYRKASHRRRFSVLGVDPYSVKVRQSNIFSRQEVMKNLPGYRRLPALVVIIAIMIVGKP